jgi:hypothetical protein
MFHEFLRAEKFERSGATRMPSPRDQIISDDRCQHFVRDAKINSQEADRVAARATLEPVRRDDDRPKSVLKLKN